MLWEFAFEYLTVAPAIVGSDMEDTVDGVFRVSADNPVLPFYAELLGYAMRKPEAKKPQTVRWSTEGAGSMNPAVQTNDDTGVFTSTLTMPPTAGSEAVVVAELFGNDDVQAKYRKVVVVPGEPANIDIATQGEASMLGYGALRPIKGVKSALDALTMF